MSEMQGGPTDFTGGSGNETPRRAETGVAVASRAKMARQARRAQQFSKFKLSELNLVPLVDTLVAIVFFSLATATVGELVPVTPGVTLPDSRVGENTLQQLTVGIGPQVVVGTRPVMTTAAAAQSVSNMPNQPLVIPQLLTALKQEADSIRREKNIPGNQSVDVSLAIQGDRSMRYDLLSRVMQTARLAGFKNISLQVNRTGAPGTGAPSSPTG